jgi:hypothetical protein
MVHTVPVALCPLWRAVTVHLANVGFVAECAKEAIGITQPVFGDDVAVCDEAIALQGAHMHMVRATAPQSVQLYECCQS